MIAGSEGAGTKRRSALWLARPARGPEPPPRQPVADRRMRAAFFAFLKAAGIDPTGGAHLSHAGGHVAYLTEAESAGIDLEWVRVRDVLALAEFAFSPSESASLASLPAEDRAAAFTELWVLKEAAAKLLGLDLFTALARCHFIVRAGQIEALAPCGRNCTAVVWAPTPLLRIAWVALGEVQAPACLEWDQATGKVTDALWRRIAATQGVLARTASAPVATAREIGNPPHWTP